MQVREIRMESLGHPRLTDGMTTLSTANAAVAIGAAIAAGFFFAFSALVMPALDERPGEDAIGAMQAINRHAMYTPFMLVLFGTALAAIVVAVWSLVSRSPGTPWAIAGVLVLWLTAVLLSGIVNIPLNNALALLPAVVPDAGTVWAQYSSPWTLANHGRAFGSAIAAVAFAIAALRSAT